MCSGQSFLDSMFAKGTCPSRSCAKQLRMHRVCHQFSFCYHGTTNVGHKPNQVSSTLDSFILCDPKVFSEAKPSTQLYSQVLDAPAPRDFVFTVYNLRVLEESPVTSKPSVFSGAISRLLLSNQRFACRRLSLILSSRIPTSSAAHTRSASSAKPMMFVLRVGNRHTWRLTRMVPPTIPFTYHFLFLLLWRFLPLPGWRPLWTCLFWSQTGFLTDCSRLSHDFEIFAESNPLAASPLCPIDILVYWMKLYHFSEDLIRRPVNSRCRIGLQASTHSLQFFECKKLPTLNCSETLVLSWEWFYPWKRVLHNVPDQIRIVEVQSPSSSNQSLVNCFEAETPWILINFTVQILPAPESAFLYASPKSREVNWSFQQYIELLLRLCPWRGIEWTHAATNFRLVTRTKFSNDPVGFTQLSPPMSLIFSRYSRSISLLRPGFPSYPGGFLPTRAQL